MSVLVRVLGEINPTGYIHMDNLRRFIIETGSYEYGDQEKSTVCHMQAGEQERCMCAIQPESEDLGCLKY